MFSWRLGLKQMINVYLHAILNHGYNTIPVNLVWAWQDQATAERILKLKCKNG